MSIGPQTIAWIKDAMANWPRVKDATNRVLSLRGDGVDNTSAGIVIRNRRRNAQANSDMSRDSFWAKISSSVQDGTNKRWKYQIAEVKKGSAGYGGWTAVDKGLSGTAYNSIEDINVVTGTFGNGVASTNLTGTITIKPVPTNVVLLARIVFLTDGTSEFWFDYENGIDGEC